MAYFSLAINFTGIAVTRDPVWIEVICLSTFESPVQILLEPNNNIIPLSGCPDSNFALVQCAGANDDRRLIIKIEKRAQIIG